MGIFSNNLDEFFRVRVAEVRRLISVSSGGDRQQSKDLLAAIQTQVVALQKEFDRIYEELMHELGARRIYLINETQLDPGQAQFVQEYFTATVLPELEPILLSESQPIPALNDESLYLAVDIRSGDSYNYAVVEVPTDRLDRFIEIPRRKGKQGKVFIVLDNIIRACLPQMFRGVIPIDEASAFCFKFSRDAELSIDTGIDQTLIDKMALSLKQRRKADAVRMVYDEDMPKRLLDYISARFGFGKYDSLIAGGRYHNSKDFMSFPRVGPRYTEFKPQPPIRLPRLDEQDSIFDAIREKDVLLYYPYHPYDYVIDLLKTAALDPQVTEIKICLYRVAKDSRVIDALVNAVHNGKRVMAVVELAARFDEAANISWAERLTDSGINVIFGLPGLKVHSKLLLIERKEGLATRYYSHVGTGNFNEKTARIYTDFTLLTYDQNVGKDLFSVFDFLQYNYRRPDYRLLLVSPHSMRPGILSLIEQEIANARAGYRASMTLKCNNLVDKELVTKLYEASQAGVEVRLIIRGMCSLLPGVKGISENIEAISIVDRYLEHPRVYVFYNRGHPRYMISSADLMTRNLDFRVEVLCPVFDRDAQRTLQNILDQQWHDNVKARIIDKGQGNEYVPRKRRVARIRSQETIHEYLRSGKLPRFPRSEMHHSGKRRRKTGTDTAAGRKPRADKA
ncbi:MAG: polyphosphate kinase 1 [Halieaceae bacterium]|nr:polyphosphate kinase 1 [Halieaceae bacterium]